MIVGTHIEGKQMVLYTEFWRRPISLEADKNTIIDFRKAERRDRRPLHGEEKELQGYMRSSCKKFRVENNILAFYVLELVGDQTHIRNATRYLWVAFVPL